jgi:hypothetical protein
VPYPYAAWPESEPRPWENNIEARATVRGSIGPKILIRADPAMYAVGAQVEPMTRTPNPSVRRRNELDATMRQSVNASNTNISSLGMVDARVDQDKADRPRMDEVGRRVEERGLLDLILGELETKSPRSFRGLFDVLRGRYSLETRPSAPASSSLGIIG